MCDTCLHLLLRTEHAAPAAYLKGARGVGGIGDEAILCLHVMFMIGICQWLSYNQRTD
jgi:hypothetical protein